MHLATGIVTLLATSSLNCRPKICKWNSLNTPGRFAKYRYGLAAIGLPPPRREARDAQYPLAKVCTRVCIQQVHVLHAATKTCILGLGSVAELVKGYIVNEKNNLLGLIFRMAAISMGIASPLGIMENPTV